MPECINAWTNDEECSFQYPLIAPLRMREILNVDMSARIRVLYDLEQTGEVVVGFLKRIEY